MPSIPVIPIENNKDKNAHDAPQASNNQHDAAKAHKKGKEKRKGKRGAKKSNSDANAKDDKKLKLPNPIDKPQATLDQAADFERFSGAMKAYISKEKMVHTLLDALDMERNDQGILQFKDYLPVAPSRPVGKLYDVKVEAIVATADQIKRLNASGALRPTQVQGKSNVPVPKIVTRGITSASLTAGGGTGPPPTPAAFTAASNAEPPDSPDNSLDGFDVKYSDTGEILLVEKKRFITKRFSADEMIARKLSSRAFEEDEASYRADKDQFDKDLIKITNELPAITQKMWHLLSDASQENIAKLMNCELSNANNLIAFETLRGHICDTHHPEFHAAHPNTRNFYVGIERYATNEMQVSRLKMSDSETLADYRKRIETVIKRCKTAAAIGVKATTLSFIAFVMPPTNALVQRIID